MGRLPQWTLPNRFERLLEGILPRAARLVALWAATILVHLWLIYEATLTPLTAPFNDVNLYGFWVSQVQQGQGIFGVNLPWVYPFVAIGPMLLASAIGSGSGMLAGWLIFICAINLIGLSAIVDWGQEGKSAYRSAAYYLCFLAVLGPVAIGRIDSVATFFAMLGLVQVYRGRYQLSMAFFTLGAWIKIWPVAAALAIFAATKARARLLFSAAVTTGMILVFGLAVGGNQNLVSFITLQGSRGLQVESVAATFWVWAAKLGAAGAGIYFDNQLVTNQVSGYLSGEIATLLGPVMAGAVAITAWLGFRAFKAGANQRHLFAAVLLTATLDLIVFNKVGSPQFEVWLAVPLMAGLLLQVPRWRFPLAIGVAVALLTNLVYPVFYMDLMALGSLGVWLLTIRNIGLIVMLVWANLRLTKLGARAPSSN
jgi:hypothetical protein